MGYENTHQMKDGEINALVSGCAPRLSNTRRPSRHHPQPAKGRFTKVCYVPKKKPESLSDFSCSPSARIYSKWSSHPSVGISDPGHRGRANAAVPPGQETVIGSTVIQFNVETEDAPGCIKTCVLEGKQMEWRAFIHQRTQRCLQARDNLRRGLIAVF
ncbi:hypothetical protein B0H21DRAFT_710583 [Amylocystis lapponica]|nr:hypothetical protein B0H21DRAFT_710583 [Amylocystis lapponica]